MNVDHLSPQERKLIYEIGKELKVNTRQKGRKSNRDKSMIQFFNSPANMASRFATSVFSCNPNDLCDRLRIILREKQTGNN